MWDAIHPRNLIEGSWDVIPPSRTRVVTENYGLKGGRLVWDAQRHVPLLFLPVEWTDEEEA